MAISRQHVLFLVDFIILMLNISGGVIIITPFVHRQMATAVLPHQSCFLVHLDILYWPTVSCKQKRSNLHTESWAQRSPFRRGHIYRHFVKTCSTLSLKFHPESVPIMLKLVGTEHIALVRGLGEGESRGREITLISTQQLKGLQRLSENNGEMALISTRWMGLGWSKLKSEWTPLMAVSSCCSSWADATFLLWETSHNLNRWCRVHFWIKHHSYSHFRNTLQIANVWWFCSGLAILQT